MLRPSASVCLCGILAAAIVLPGAAGAQTTQTSPPPQQPQQDTQIPRITEQVEVVATRLPEAPHEVPAAIEVLSGSALRAMGATNLRDALSLSAGVEVAQGGDAGPAGSVPEFWGLKEFDAFLLVVDDIPWGGAFSPALATLSLRDVERVEVLRGSAPVTFGATSFVGVIHVVHKSGAEAASYGSVRGGSYGTVTGGADLALPQLGEWKSRLSADVDRQGFADKRTSFLRGHASFRTARTQSKGRAWFLADLNVLRQDPASPHPREGAQLSSNVAIDSNYNPNGAFLNDTRFTTAFGLERQAAALGEWSLTGSFSHSSQGIFRGFLTDIAGSPDNASGFREDIDVSDVYLDTHFTWPERSHVRVIAGGDLLFGNGEAKGATFTYTVPLSATPAVQVTEPADLDLDSGARRIFGGLYVMTEYTPAPRLRFDGGLRLNVTNERHGEGESFTNTRVSGSLGALVGVWEQGTNHVRLFASYRNTFKPAAFDFSLAENEGVLKPETAQSYEGGIKIRAASGRLDIEASAFRMDFENLVTSTVVGGLPALINAGKTRFQGFEIASAVQGPYNLSGRMTYSFHDGTFVDFVQAFDGVPQQLGGKRFEMSARHLLSAGVLLSPDRGLMGSVIVKYTGDRFLNKRNSALAEPFTTVDAGLGLRIDRWEVRVDGHNLTDRRDAIAESELGDAQYYLMPARRLDLSCGVRF